jgi:iron complex transport system permease protein
MTLLLAVSRKFSDKSYLIIFGFLVSALAGAVVSMLQLYAEDQSLKNYILWSFGANNTATKNQIYILGILVIIGLFFCFKTIKPLIGNSLGSAYAQSFGVNLNRLKILIIATSSLLSASVTAFIGPILFVGIIVPHFCRMIYNPSKLWHQWLLNMLLGIAIMLVFSIFAEKSHIPINVISSVFGIPVILMMLLKQSRS